MPEIGGFQLCFLVSKPDNTDRNSLPGIEGDCPSLHERRKCGALHRSPTLPREIDTRRGGDHADITPTEEIRYDRQCLIPVPPTEMRYVPGANNNLTAESHPVSEGFDVVARYQSRMLPMEMQ